MDSPHSMLALTSESTHLQCGLLTNGTAYLSQSGQLQARRPSSVSLRRPEIDTSAPRMDIKEWKKTAQRHIPGGQQQRRPAKENQYDNGLPQRSLEVSDTLLHGGLDSSPQVTSKNGCLHRVLACSAGGPRFDYRLRSNILRWSMQRM